MNTCMTSKTIVTLRRRTPQGEIAVTIVGPGHLDEPCIMQYGSETVLMYLHEILPTLAVGAIPMEVQDYIMNAVVKETCASASASASEADSSRA